MHPGSCGTHSHLLGIGIVYQAQSACHATTQCSSQLPSIVVMMDHRASFQPALCKEFPHLLSSSYLDAYTTGVIDYERATIRPTKSLVDVAEFPMSYITLACTAQIETSSAMTSQPELSTDYSSSSSSSSSMGSTSRFPPRPIFSRIVPPSSTA